MREANLKRLFFFLAGLALVLGAAGPASAGFDTSDLDGNWEFFALGYYEVFTTYAFGSLTINTGLITGGSGQYHSSPAQYGGAINLAADGSLTAEISGTYGGGDAFSYQILSGRMNSRKDAIVGSGQDHRWWMCTFYLIKTN